MAKSKKGNPDDSTIVERLAESIGLATKSSKFCVAGSLPLASPRIEVEVEVEGLGVLVFTLKPATVKKLVARCRQAPYGKGTETLVDTKVRKTFELDPASFRLDEAWNAVYWQPSTPYRRFSHGDFPAALLAIGDRRSGPGRGVPGEVGRS